MALGAAPGRLVADVLRDGLRIIIGGVGAARAGAARRHALIEAFLFGIDSRDRLTFALASLLLASVSAVACLIPAMRACTRGSAARAQVRIAL